MYTTITAQCIDQTLTVTHLPVIASGGSNVVRVEVQFDDLWDAFGRVAVFYRNKNKVFHVLMVDDACLVPWEVLAEPGVLYFGVMGSAGSTTRTSAVVALKVEQGSVAGVLADAVPLPNIYRQLLAAYGKNAAALSVERARIDNIVADRIPADDSEVADLRVDIDGITHNSAGTAVRYQAEELRSNILEVFNMIKIVRGKNLYNSAADTFGYLSPTGAIIASPDLDWKTTGFIDVRELEAVICSGEHISDGIRYTASFFFLCSYDDKKRFIEQVYTTGQHSYTVGDNVSYIRFCYHSDEICALQVESGTTKTEFEEYHESYEFSENQSYLNKPYIGKKWTCIGDSLTEVNSRTDKNYHAYVAEKTGITVDNRGFSGSGYKRSEDNGKAFYQTARYIPADADVVTIFGSGNDLAHISALGTPTDTDAETICGCVNMAIDNIIAVKPDVSLGIVSPTPWVSYPPSNPDNAMAKYTEALRQICERRSIPFLDLYHCSNLRPWTEEGRAACYTKDDGNGVHPDETGHALIAARFKAFLESLLL